MLKVEFLSQQERMSESFLIFQGTNLVAWGSYFFSRNPRISHAGDVRSKVLNGTDKKADKVPGIHRGYEKQGSNTTGRGAITGRR